MKTCKNFLHKKAKRLHNVCINFCVWNMACTCTSCLRHLIWIFCQKAATVVIVFISRILLLFHTHTTLHKMSKWFLGFLKAADPQHTATSLIQPHCSYSHFSLSHAKPTVLICLSKHRPAMRAEPTKCWFVSKRKQTSRAWLQLP